MTRLLMPIDLPEAAMPMFTAHFEVIHIPEGAGWDSDLSGIEADAVLTRGSIGFARRHFDALPGVGIVCCLGAGHENVDLDLARERGVRVTNGSGANAATVADHAMALMLALLRDILPGDQAVRAGRWHHGFGMPRSVGGKRLGILGLGHIGRLLALRGAAFDMSIAYCNRKPRADVAWDFVGSALELAERSDVLAIALPGGAETHHMVDADVLAALGPQGYLVNVGRGAVVDEAALIAALTEGRIAGAALDVFEHEPEIPAGLLAAPNVLMTPHIGGRSPDSHAAARRLALDNLLNHVAGRPLINRVA